MTLADPLAELALMLAAASQTDNESVRLMFVARARNAYAVATLRLEESGRLLYAQEKELERGKR